MIDKKERDIRVVIFDADDTLWDCQTWFDRAEDDYCRLLSPWVADASVVKAELVKTERANMPLLGYGTKAFTISAMETALRITDGQVEGSVLQEIIAMGKRLLRFPVAALPEVDSTLRQLHEASDFQLVVFTKGELMGQQDKLLRSGLQHYFSHVEIVADKTVEAYQRLCQTLRVNPCQTLMVGNSFRSDMAPALEAGAWAVHIPFHAVWALEVAEEYPHERLQKITHFAQLLDVLGICGTNKG